MSDAKLFVTGASGNLGRRVVELLIEAGAAGRVIAGTRSPEKLADLSAQGVEVRFADFEDVASLAPAFQGAERLLLISSLGDDRLSQQLNALHAAEAVGVKHVIYTSIVNPTNTPVTIASDHAATEAALEASSVSWTVLRNNIYAEVAAQSIEQALQFGGVLANAVGDGLHSYIAREDCARAAAAALLSDFEGKRVLNITSSEAISQVELAAIASQITGTSITYTPLSLEQVKQNLLGAGLPPALVEMIASFDAGGAADKFDLISDDFKTLTGREPLRPAEALARLLAK